MLEFVVFSALVLLRVVLLAAGAALLIPRVRHCPACFQPTVPIVSRALARFAPWLERRWCPECGWQGLGRKSVRRVDRARGAPAPAVHLGGVTRSPKDAEPRR